MMIDRRVISFDAHGREIATRVRDGSVIGTPEDLAAAISKGGWTARAVMPILEGCMQFVQRQMGRPANREPAQQPLNDLESPAKQLQR